MTVTVAEVSVLKESDTLPLFGVTLPVAWPVTLSGMRKWPVKAARAAGEVNTFVWGVELLVTVGVDWMPGAERLTDWVTEGMTTGTAPVGTLIDSLAEVVAWSVWPVDAALSAENCEVNDPEVTTSTSVKVPIVALK
jgi:hypothetical protein